MPTPSAQTGLYPLRQATFSEPIDDLLRLLRERGLDVRPGVMSTLVRGDTREIFQALE